MFEQLHKHRGDIERLLAAWGAFILAINWNAVAAFLTCVFTLLLIIEKFGLLAPMKEWGSRKWKAFRNKGVAE